MSVLNELGILKRLLPGLPQNDSVLTGPGDDCAVLRWNDEEDLLVTVDQLIEKIHYTPETPPEKAGAKLMKRNLSDIAAMGGTPLWAVLTAAVCGRDEEYIFRFISGAAEAGKEYGVALCGGDISSCPDPGLTATLTLAGKVPHGQAVLRSGASPGEKLYVSGEIGNSFLSGHHLEFTPHLAAGAALRGHVSAMLDISDGLALDCSRLAAASGVDLILDIDAIPLRKGAKMPQALGDGEDYVLLFTSNKELPWHCIGRVAAGNGRLLNKDLQEITPHGYQH